MVIPKFTAWMKFDEYKNISEKNSPGIYLLATFNKKPTGRANPLAPEIFYIGETTKQNLAKRLYQFSRSAFSRKSAHSGGWSYSKHILKNQPRKAAPKNLYVAVISINKSEPENTIYIKLAERTLLWNYFKKNNSPPNCNKI